MLSVSLSAQDPSSHCCFLRAIVQGFKRTWISKDYLQFTFQRFDANVPPACSISVGAHMPHLLKESDG
jgi:hypothetical protein